MIIIDYSQIAMANFHAELEGKFEPDLFKHMLLNSIRGYKKKFHNEYGSTMVIAVDSRTSWRKGIFPHYKIRRHAAKDKDDEVDFEKLYAIMNEVQKALSEHFPYSVIEVDGAEGDDIIGTIIQNTKEKSIVISTDKDFKQLGIYPNFTQFSPTKKEYLKASDPALFLKEQIIRGDSGDDIPNVLSVENSFADKIRQKSVYQKKLDEWLYQEPSEFLTEEQLNRYALNTKLIDLRCIPDHISKAIMDQFNVGPNPNANPRAIMDYFINNRMKILLDYIEEF